MVNQCRNENTSRSCINDCINWAASRFAAVGVSEGTTLIATDVYRLI